MFAGFFGAGTLVASSIYSGDGIIVGLARGYVGIAKRWGFNELGADFCRRSSSFAAVDVVAGEVVVGIGVPCKIDERLLARAGEDSLQSSGNCGRENIVGDDGGGR